MKSTAIKPTKSKIQNLNSRILLIGYGNTLRGDDGAGQQVATAIAKRNLPNLQAIAVHQLLPELAEPLAAAQLAIFVDVYPADAGQGLQIRRLEASLNSERLAGHTADPRSLLALTEQVYGMAPDSWWVLIPAIQFEFGERISAVAEQGINEALQQIQQLVKESQADIAEEIRIRGTVQGVGFRPMVYRLATAYQLRGEVCNDGQGVLIRALGNPTSLDEFVRKIQQESPPLATITKIQRQSIDTNTVLFESFQITPSLNTSGNTHIAADAATCPSCQAEIFDLSSRWYHYPFTNCTHCGPRLSIIRALPYDRYQTSMAEFPMCSACREDYEDVNNRRFHAQPIACPDCGPHVWLEQAGRSLLDLDLGGDAIASAKELLLQGKIIAIKGLGGFHLVCDATNETAVQTLRNRKHRDHKPFALMARDLSIIEQYCTLSPEALHLLESPAAPIVLLPIKQKTRCSEALMISSSVAPGLSTLGFMLPYTPLHHLLFQNIDRPLVFTSGNRSHEPQCIDNEEARVNLSHIADYLLLHNREIINRVDDSIVRVIGNQPQICRRARGYAPTPMSLPLGFESAPKILAMGSELKNTFCLIRSGQAILSQHLGDLEQAETLAAYRQTLNLYLNLFEHHPEAIALDLHPDYLSTKLGQELAIAHQLKTYAIQHHHAHIAACMVENQLPLNTAPVLGIALDGIGYGSDRTLWGGEFLLADYRTFTRIGSLKPIAMLGGALAVEQPWRNTYTHLMTAIGWQELQSKYGNLELIFFLEQQPRPLLDQLLAKNINTPLASSCGRLFDAVAAALDLYRERCWDEGEGAIALEAMATNFLDSPQGKKITEENIYPFAIHPTQNAMLILEPRPLWQALLQDLQQGISKPEIAARFHLGLAQAIANLTLALHDQHPFSRVALTGGVFQNAILLQQVQQRLTALGFTVLTHHLIPPNDGGLSLGQGAIAAAQFLAQQ